MLYTKVPRLFLTCYAITGSLFAGTQPATQLQSPVTRATATPEANPVKEKAGGGFFDNVTGIFDLTSNYLFRGLTQTQNLPAAQGGFTYTTPLGFYATLWGSNNKFLGTDINMEVDPGFGFYKAIGDNFTLDVSFYRYIYPSDRIWNYNEWLAQCNYRFLQMNLGYSSNVYNVKRSGVYYDGGINYSIPPEYLFNLSGVKLLALAGRYELPEGFPEIVGISYNTYILSISKDFKHYNLAFQYSNTNERAFYQGLGGQKLVGTLTATF